MKKRTRIKIHNAFLITMDVILAICFLLGAVFYDVVIYRISIPMMIIPLGWASIRLYAEYRG